MNSAKNIVEEMIMDNICDLFIRWKCLCLIKYKVNYWWLKCREKIDLKINLYVYYKSYDSSTILFYLEHLAKKWIQKSKFFAIHYLHRSK